MTKFAGSLDANVLLRILLNDVPAQKAAAMRLLGEHRGQFAVADIALCEMAFVLDRYYGFARADIADALRDIMAEQQFNCNRALFARASQLFVQHPALSLEDCALATYAELNEATPLYTFDQKLANQAPAAQQIPS